MKILLIGANGQLGTDLTRVLAEETPIRLTHQDVEITDQGSIRSTFEKYRPDIVINTAAFHRVDDCENQPEKAFRVNAVGVGHLATICRELGSTLLHFSTDYVFDGDKGQPYTEDDSPRPLNVYGVSKLAGEYLVATTLRRHFLIRTSGLFGIGGSKSKGGNFVESMLRRGAEGRPMRVVNDQVLTPTYTVDLARKIAELIHTEAYGLYHITSNGSCTWFDFAERIFQLAGVQADLSPTTTEAFGAPARRPRYSVLRNARLEQMGLDDMPVWEDALRRYLYERVQALGKHLSDTHPSPMFLLGGVGQLSSSPITAARPMASANVNSPSNVRDFDLVISITAWNVCALLRKCLLSVFQNPPTGRWKVVVVDDHSADGTAEIVRKEFPQVDLIVSEDNLGFIRANNLVLRRYSGMARYYLLLNADTVVQPEAFDELMKFLDANPETGIIGGKLVLPNGALDWACKRCFPTPSIFFYRALGLDRLFPKSPRFGRYQLRYLDENETHEVDAVCGALLMIRSDTLQQIGLMDEDLFIYGDDLDWCYRAKKAGWKVIYYPRASVVHHKSQSYKKRPYFIVYWWYKALWIVYRKNISPHYSALTNAIVWGGLYIMCGVSLVTNFLRPDKRLPSRR